jgi:hypothetical protein
MSAPIPPAAAVAIGAALGEHELAPFAFSGDSVLHDGRGDRYTAYVQRWSTRTRSVRSMVDELSSDASGATLGLLGLGARGDVVAAQERIGERHGSLVQTALFPAGDPMLDGSWVVLVRAAGVSKGTAVAWLAEHYSVPLSEVAAVGDWLNDIPMMRAAGRSFAMAQAPAVVKAAASDQLVSDIHSGGGIAEAASRLGLLEK